MADYVGALDAGTTSTRFMVFDHEGRVVAIDQKEHEQIFPRPGWVEHDPLEMRDRMFEVITGALENAGLRPDDLAAVGITNQRETAVAWDPTTGEPIGNAIVWQDTRTAELVAELGHDGGQDRFRGKTGLPLATYFSGPKFTWMLDDVDGLRERGRHGRAFFGTVDSWALWNLTGGVAGGVHATDVTNASRTMLMDLESLAWDSELAEAMRVPLEMLPDIKPSVGVFGTAVSPLDGVPVSGILGDQQAALFGQACFEPGDAKNTYGTGCFMLMNTGNTPIASDNGLLTTVAYQVDGGPAAYALEGSIAIAGALVQWLRDNLGLIDESEDIEALAAEVVDNGGVYFVPAFSGLFAPHWRSDARGVIAGLTRFANAGHLARAVLEATAFQTREVLDAMRADSNRPLAELKVDGGMVRNEMLMQFQADLLDLPVIRPKVAETTALGAAYAAGLAVGFWQDFGDVRRNWSAAKKWTPSMDDERRDGMMADWNKAVERTLDWA